MKLEANMVVESSTVSPSIPILEYSFMDQPLEFEPEANMFEAHMIYLHTSRFLCLIDCAYLVEKSSRICICVMQWIQPHDMGIRWERDNASCQASGKYYPSY